MSVNKYTTFLKKISLLFFSVLSVMAMGEIYLWSVGFDDLANLKNGREIILQPSSNADIKYELTPGAKGYAWRTDVDINSSGYRGQMGKKGKFNGFRAITIGDSITFGNFIPLEATYAYRLDKLLKQKDPQYEILNFGVGGYDILQSVSLFEEKGPAYKPDLVIVGYCHNDIGIASPNQEYIARVQKYQSNVLFRLRITRFLMNKIDAIRIGKWVDEKNRKDVFRKDYKENIAVIGKEEHALRQAMENTSTAYPFFWYKDEDRLGRLRYSFARLADIARKEKFKVVVLIFPWLAVDGDQYPYKTAHKIVTMEAKSFGFDVLEVSDEFMNVGMKKLQVQKYDVVHPNEIGHQIVAESLEKYILERYPLQK